MKDDFAKKIELFANVAIIVVAIILAGVLVKRFVFTAPAASAPKENIAVGAAVDLPNVDWAGNEKTLLLILSTDCRYCHESLPFYQKLSAEISRNGRVKLIAAFPQETPAGEEYLKSNGVTVSRVIQANPPSLGVGGTPSLLLVGKDGKVAATWFGKLVPDQEKKVFDEL